MIAQVEDPNCTLPESARAFLKVLTATLTSLEENIAALDVEINRRSKEDSIARRLLTLSGSYA